jgi:hypothetical protein
MTEARRHRVITSIPFGILQMARGAIGDRRAIPRYAI